MKRKMKITIAILSCAFSMFWTTGFAKNINTQTAIQAQSAAESVHARRLPNGVMRATEPLFITCSKISSLIRRDKEQYQSVLRYLASNDCYNEPAASSHTCRTLFSKRENLLARIEANQLRARDLGCI